MKKSKHRVLVNWKEKCVSGCVRWAVSGESTQFKAENKILKRMTVEKNLLLHAGNGKMSRFSAKACPLSAEIAERGHSISRSFCQESLRGCGAGRKPRVESDGGAEGYSSIMYNDANAQILEPG